MIRRRYIIRQAGWHPEDVHHLMPAGPPTAFLLNRWDQRVRNSVTETAARGLVLDVGCGNARDIAELGNAGWRRCGVEPSSKQIQDALNVLRAYGSDGWLVRAVAEHLPFRGRRLRRRDVQVGNRPCRGPRGGNGGLRADGEVGRPE